jgi:hypothetical protein
LPDTCFVLPPQFYFGAGSQVFPDRGDFLGECFLYRYASKSRNF